MKSLTLFSLLLAGFWSLAAIAEVEISEVWARESIPGTSSSALFATLKNTGKKAVVLNAVQVEGADKTELHATQDDGGMMRMRRLESIPVPAGDSVSLAPGGYHVMLFRLAAPLREGQQVAAEFQFANGEKVAAVALVRSAKGTDHHHHHH